MKYIDKFFCATAVMALAASCATKEILPESQEEAIPEGYEKVAFSVTTQDVKTMRPEEGEFAGKTVWVKNDQLKMLYESGYATATLQGDGGSISGTFLAVLPGGVQQVYAVYPNALGSSLDEGSVSVTVPAVQDGSFATCNIAVAKADAEKNLAFYNINTLLKVIVGSGVTRISVESVDGSPLVGTANVSFTGSGIEFGENTGGASSFESNLPGDAGTYYFSVLSGVTHSKGLLLKYYKGEEESGKYLLDKSVKTTVNKILSFGEFEPTNNYYVTVSGAGNKNGLSWANAMDVKAFKKLVFNSGSYSGTRDDDADMLKYSTLNGATIHMGAGDYIVAGANADWPTIGFSSGSVGSAFSLNIIGGYDANGSATPDPSKNITAIKGNGGDDVGRLINLEYKSNVHFDGITFTENHGNAGGAAAVRIAHGAQHFNNCRFVDNTNNASACAMHVGNAQAYLTDCTFSGNIADSGCGINIDGNSDTYVSLTNCNFSDNTASQYGGAIRLVTGTLDVNGGSFTGNTATRRGGAIYVTSTSAVAGISGATFTSNGECTDTDYGQGGAIYSGEGASTEISGCTFASNTARMGGAIGCVNDNSNINTISVDGCSFNENTSTDVGGVMILTSKGSFNVTNSTFENNIAGGNGGAISCDNVSGKFTFDNVVFKGGISSRKGGVFQLDNGTYRINKCCFNGNKANQAGAICAGSTNTIYLNDCLFTGNYSTGNLGTTMRIESTNNTLCMNNCTFADNTYTVNGTIARHAEWIYLKNNKTVLSNSTLIGYSRKGSDGSDNSGGAQLIEYENSGTTNITFVNNIIAHSNGKEIFNKNSGTANLTTVSNKVTTYKNVIPATSGEEGTGFKGTSDYFGDLSYVSNANPTWNNCYWRWNGTLAKGSDLDKDTAEKIITAIQNADRDFYNWLDEVDGIYSDGQGNFRGNGEWWPGAYQGEAGSVSGTPINVMSFNTLYKGYDDTSIDSGPVAEKKPERLWANRAPGCYAMIAGLQPDIIGMQECEYAQKTAYMANCTVYGVYGVDRKTGYESGKKDEHVPILYKKSVLSMESKGTFWLSPTPTRPGSKFDNADCPRTATWAVMKVKATSQKFFFVNAHLSTDSGARASEINVLLSGIDSRNTSNLPVIITGDQNEIDTDACFDAFRNADYTCTRRKAATKDTGITFHAFGFKAEVIDNIWQKGCTAVNSFTVDRQTWSEVQYISDHYPVYSTIVL